MSGQTILVKVGGNLHYENSNNPGVPISIEGNMIHNGSKLATLLQSDFLGFATIYLDIINLMSTEADGAYQVVVNSGGIPINVQLTPL